MAKNLSIVFDELTFSRLEELKSFYDSTSPLNYSYNDIIKLALHEDCDLDKGDAL